LGVRFLVSSTLWQYNNACKKDVLDLILLNAHVPYNITDGKLDQTFQVLKQKLVEVLIKRHFEGVVVRRCSRTPMESPSSLTGCHFPTKAMPTAAE